ncbi:MAG: molybdopterin-dependent oxidoreductase [Thermoplasmata archaeon]|nr:molybdopterin-dependent oxidoreductase [Thermoplasmata archaeon]
MPFSACPKDCFDSCSIITENSNGIRIRGNPSHPITSGFLCYKAKFFVDSAISDKRLRRPLLRDGKRGEGEFIETSLDRALDIVSEKIRETIKECGAECILPLEYAGNRALISYYFPRRFFNKIGSSFLNHSLCDEAGSMALRSILGTSVGMDPEKLKEMKMIVYWGINPAWTNVHGWRLAKLSKAKIYVIDPVRTESAKGADVHLDLRPGTDIPLVLSILNVLSRYGISSPELSSIVSRYDPEYAGRITGLGAKKIEDFALDLLDKRPFAIHMGYGFQRNLYGGLSVKTIAYMMTLLGMERNFIYDAKHGIDYEYLGGISKNKRLINQVNLGRELEKNDIRMIFVYNTNPLNSLPNQNLLRDVIQKKDIFIVVHDLFLTDTALFSDLIIPAASFFEFNDLVDSYYHDYINLNQKVMDPPGEAISNHDLFVLLSKKMGFNEPYLLEDEWSIIDNIINMLKINKNDLLKKGFARIERVRNEIIINKSNLKKELENFTIPSRDGYFRLISSTSIYGVGSQFNNLYSFDTYAHINPHDAMEMGIDDGDSVRIMNEYGMIITNVKLDDSIGRGIVLIYRGSWPSIHGWNVNFLTTDSVQEYSMGASMNSTFVKVEKV